MPAPIWPNSVYVLTKTDKLDGGIGVDDNYWPMTAVFWLQLELRQVVNIQTIHQISMMHDAWMREWQRLWDYRNNNKLQNRISLHDLYNATWASLGYTENQCPKALSFQKEYATALKSTPIGPIRTVPRKKSPPVKRK